MPIPVLRRSSLAAVCAVAGLVLSGCAQLTLDPPTNHGKITPQALNPLGLERKLESLAVEIDGGVDGLSALQRAKLDDFLAKYRSNGQPPLRIVVGGAADNQDKVMQPARLLRLYAEAKGIDPTQINTYYEVASGEAQGLSVISYDRLVVKLPDCPKVTTSQSFNPYNELHPNFGCATQRYIGQMVANPADLVRARKSEPSDAARSDRAIEKYRSGESTVTQVGGQEQTIQRQIQQSVGSK